MVINKIRSDINAIEQNPALFAETNFAGRVAAIDTIEFNIIDRLEGLLQTPTAPAELAALKQSAERVKRQLETIDNNLFERLRADIRAGALVGAALAGVIKQYAGGGSQPNEIGYDNFDAFINGLLLNQPAPGETKNREPEMVYYQQTPIRVILELVEQARFTANDVFYDLGSGLGQVPILVNLLSGVTAKGIEFEPAYCTYAQGCAAGLNLARVAFINADARHADYADGTVFFMYTPFEGSLLQTVLEKLRAESRRRIIRLFTYGPCTPPVSRQNWLKRLDQNGGCVDKLAVFTSF